MSAACRFALAGLALAVLGPAAALAQDDAWNPFVQKDERARVQRGSARTPTEPLPSPDGRPAQQPSGSSAYEPAPPWRERESQVERGELAPVLANDGSGLPLELWQGLDIQTIEQHVAQLGGPVRSHALQDVWRRVWTSEASPPAGSRGAGHFFALRFEALYRSGRLNELRKLLARPNQPDGPLVATLEARLLLGLGEREAGCNKARDAVRMAGDLPKPMRLEAVLVSGYCAGASGNTAAASLAADLAREQHSEPSLALSVLDALASGGTPKVNRPQRISLLDYRFLELGRVAHADQVIDRAEPALLVALALDASVAPATRAAAAEAACAVSAMSPTELAEVYRSIPMHAAELANAGSGASPALRRAQLYRAAEMERLPLARARLMRQLLDEGRRAGISFQTAAFLGDLIADMRPAPDIAWFAETATEALLAAGRYAQARSWAESAPAGRGDGSLLSWLALIDLADASVSAPHSGSLAHMQPVAARGGFSPEDLHRVVTVFDSLDFQIPIDLWQQASRTPQPDGGHLPDTGVLSQLQDAAKKREVARTLLLSLDTLGPNGARGAHMIALGDTLKALKRAGLEADARRLGLEALYATWPRTVSN